MEGACDTIKVVQREHRVTLLFAGDAMCHTPQIYGARRADGSLDFTEKFAATKPYFDRADVAVVNIETTISANKQYSGYPCFASPEEYADALAWLGTDIALLANNHCFDQHARGIRKTIAKLDTLRIAHTGAFSDEQDFAKNEILRFEHDSIRFALVNYTYGTNGIPTPKGCFINLIDTIAIAKTLQRATQNSDCVIACMHWGVEYLRQPHSSQLQLAKFLHRQGVDLVIGSHPHVVQPYLASEDQITIFSLGNFISNQNKPHTDGGIMAEIEVVKGVNGECRYSLNVIPVWVKKPGHKLVTPDTAEEEKMTPYQRQLYNLFIRNTELLLSGGKR